MQEYRGIDLSRFVDAWLPTTREELCIYTLLAELAEPTTDGHAVFGSEYDGVVRTVACFDIGASVPRWRTTTIDVASNAIYWDGSVWVGTRGDGEHAELLELSPLTGTLRNALRLPLDSRSPFVLHFSTDARWARVGDDVWRVSRESSSTDLVATQIAQVSWMGAFGVLDNALGVEASGSFMRVRNLSSGEACWSTEVSLRGMSLTLDPFRRAINYGRNDYRGGIHVLALDAQSGEEIWNHPLEVQRIDLLDAFAIATHPERIFIRDGSSRILALSPETGAELWRVSLSQLSGEILATQNLLLVTGEALYALDTRTGAKVFELPADHIPLDIDLLGTSPRSSTLTVR